MARYCIWLMDEIPSGVIDWEKPVEPTPEERQSMADWEASGPGFSFFRLEMAWEGHPKNAIAAWEGYSVVLIAEVSLGG